DTDFIGAALVGCVYKASHAQLNPPYFQFSILARRDNPIALLDPVGGRDLGFDSPQQYRRKHAHHDDKRGQISGTQLPSEFWILHQQEPWTNYRQSGLQSVTLRSVQHFLEPNANRRRKTYR